MICVLCTPLPLDLPASFGSGGRSILCEGDVSLKDESAVYMRKNKQYK